MWANKFLDHFVPKDFHPFEVIKYLDYPGEPIHEGTYQEILKLRKEIWITVRDLKDLIYLNNIHEDCHIQNRTLNSILAKHTTCSNLNSLFKMHLDAQALKYQYENRAKFIPSETSQMKRKETQD
ncbi:33K protein [unidentified adenovirus]|nr:33K protein [unidentified adenovirus]